MFQEQHTQTSVIGTCQLGSCLLSGCVQVQNPWKTILSRKYRPQLVLAAASTFFQQWTGINTIIFYAPQLFVSLGVGEGAALGATIVTGIVNHLATYVSFHVADKYGRRILFIEGENCVCAFVCRYAIVISRDIQISRHIYFALSIWNCCNLRCNYYASNATINSNRPLVYIIIATLV